MVDEKIQVRCPHRKLHNKKRSDVLISDNHCSALLGFLDPEGSGEHVFKCRDCKRLTTATIKNGSVYLEKMRERQHVPIAELGKVIVLNVSSTTA